MELISISLASNRGSYEEGAIIPGEFDQLAIHSIHSLSDYTIQTSDPKEIQKFINQHSNQFIAGFIGYDLGFQMVTSVSPKQRPLISSPPCFLVAVDPEQVVKTRQEPVASYEIPPIHLNALVSQKNYFESVQQLKDHIQQGDIYEVNYCIPFVAENV